MPCSVPDQFFLSTGSPLDEIMLMEVGAVIGITRVRCIRDAGYKVGRQA